MELHHDRHHAAFVEGFKAAIERFYTAIKAQNVHEISLFWRILSPCSAYGGKFPTYGALSDLVASDHGTLEHLQRLMTI
ncbi:hypothetical protein JCM11641_006475 [Rhodosporidiobolus odoratus]